MKWFIMSFVPVGPFLPDVGPGHSSFWVFLKAFTQASSSCPKEVAFLSDSLRPSSLFPLSLWLREPTGGDGPLGGGRWSQFCSSRHSNPSSISCVLHDLTVKLWGHLP